MNTEQITFEDITIGYSSDGYLLLSTVFNGQLETRKYSGYTELEAKELFLEFLKTITE